MLEVNVRPAGREILYFTMEENPYVSSQVQSIALLIAKSQVLFYLFLVNLSWSYIQTLIELVLLYSS